jgi:hypothetical protein
MTYEIIRFYFDQDHPDHKRIIKRGLTKAQAEAHCQSEDTREQGPDGHTVWFDGFQKSVEVINGICIPAEITEPARVVEITDGDSICALVGGYMEALMVNPTTTCYLNEEGKLDGLPVNVRATAMMLHALHGTDVIVGDVVLLGFDPETGEDLSLPDAAERAAFINGQEKLTW